jgi:regulator of sirC expression with transglutaminase-like and TPR domain
VALEAAGDKARARQEYETYLELDPTAPDSIELRKHLHELAARK